MNFHCECSRCQTENTHMRLGTTVHIDRFYEAEILFENKF